MDTTKTTFSEGIDRLIRVIGLMLDETTNGDALASEACLSRYHFQRVFRRHLGETPGTLRRRLLLERAAYRLNATSYSVTEIAFDAGYDSLEGFCRAFHRAYGVSPSHYRRLAAPRFRQSSKNGIHYDPARGKPWRSIPKGDGTMDITDRLIEHDAWMTRRLLTRAKELTDAQLDSSLPHPQQPMPFEGPDSTPRILLEHLVFTKEAWAAAVRGQQAPERQENSIDNLITRFDAASAAFMEIVRDVRDGDRWDEMFVDELCCPAETFSYGSMIAHVITFSAFRRLTALKTLESLGTDVDDLGYGDPIDWERSLAAK